VSAAELKDAVRRWQVSGEPRITSVGLSPDREKATVEVYGGLNGRGWNSLVSMKLQHTEQGWKVVQAKELVKALKGATNER